MKQEYRQFVGLDVHKKTIVLAIANTGRTGEVRSYGEIPNTVEAIRKTFSKIKGGRMLACYEAGPCGYGVSRQLKEMGVDCDVIAPSLIPSKAGDRVKTDKRDAIQLARLLRAGELTAVEVPGIGEEALRDLTRAREDAKDAERRARQRMKAFLLRHRIVYTGSTAWGSPYMNWLMKLKLEDPAQQVVLEEYRQTIEQATARVDRMTRQVETFTKERPEVAPNVAAFQSLRGVSLVTAATMVAELGDIGRFDHPKKLMAFCGLVPSENSSGDRGRRGRITKTGNTHVRRVLVESAWSYRYPARVSRGIWGRQEKLPEPIRAISWRAQLRLCRKYQRLVAKGKPVHVAVTAVARELLAYLWEIRRAVSAASEVTRKAA